MTRSHHARRVPGAQVEPAPEILDGELITEADYARLKGWNLLPILAVAGGIRPSDHPRAITPTVLVRGVRSARTVAPALYTMGQGVASWGGRAGGAPTSCPVRGEVPLGPLGGG